MSKCSTASEIFTISEFWGTPLGDIFNISKNRNSSKIIFLNILKKYPYVGEPDNVANEYGQAGIPECPGLLTPSRHKRCVLMAIRMQM
jgi:hypothetical protein